MCINMTEEQTDKIFNVITSNECREMEKTRFHQAVNEAIDIYKKENKKHCHSDGCQNLKSSSILPGQIYEDKQNLFSMCDNSTNIYIVKSKEPGEGWELIYFQNGYLGGFIRYGFTEEEIQKMEYLGHINQIKNMNE